MNSSPEASSNSASDNELLVVVIVLACVIAVLLILFAVFIWSAKRNRKSSHVLDTTSDYLAMYHTSTRKYPWFHGLLSDAAADSILSHAPSIREGSFLVYESISNSDSSQYIIVLLHDDSIHRTYVTHNYRSGEITVNNQIAMWATSLASVVAALQKYPLYGCQTRLTHIVPNPDTQPARPMWSSSQYDLEWDASYDMPIPFVPDASAVHPRASASPLRINDLEFNESVADTHDHESPNSLMPPENSIQPDFTSSPLINPLDALPNYNSLDLHEPSILRISSEHKLELDDRLLRPSADSALAGVSQRPSAEDPGEPGNNTSQADSKNLLTKSDR